MFIAQSAALAVASGSPTFAVIGAVIGSGNSTTGSGSITTTAANQYVIFDVVTCYASAITVITVAGATPTLLGSQALNSNSANGYLSRYGILVTSAAGSKALAVTFAGTQSWMAQAIAYTGVATVGTTTFVTGNTAGAKTQSSGTLTGGKVASECWAISVALTGATLTSPTGGTTRGTGVYTNPGGTYNLMAHQDSASTVTFGATVNANPYAGGVTILNP